MGSVPNCISNLPSNFWIFSPFLAILIKFLNSKTDLDFPKFEFKTHFKSKEVSMEKVVQLFEIFKNIFYFKKLTLGKPYLDQIKFERV
jgi:hypothetical protein